MGQGKHFKPYYINTYKSAGYVLDALRKQVNCYTPTSNKMPEPEYTCRHT